VSRGALRGLGWFVLVALVLWFVPATQERFDFPISYLLFGYFLFFWIAQASSWNMFTGYSGYFSFGQGAFYGVGVYTTATLAAKRGLPLLVAIPAAGLLSALLGLIIGVVVFRLRRLRGEIFALITLAVAFVMAALARVSPAIDGGSGVPLNTVELPEFLGDFTTMMFRLGLVVATVTVFVAFMIYRSRLGWALFSISDDEDVAEALGVPTFRAKMAALGISTFLAGLSGAVHALQISYVTIEDVFNIRVPLLVIVMSVLGGMRHWMGPVVGATVVFTLTDRLNRAGLEDVNQLIIGGLLIVMVLAVKQGLYLRLRTRPWWGAAGLAAGLGIAMVVAGSGSLITKFAYGLAGAVTVLVLPVDRLGRAASEDRGGEPGPPAEVAAGEVQAGVRGADP
jgi:branched-chain amino acid transport system permease protein